MRTRCTLCAPTAPEGKHHDNLAHTATCRVCGEKTYYEDWSVALKVTDESPYRKGRRVFDCGNVMKHDALRDHASRIPGDPEAPSRKHATDGMSRTERQIQTQLWK